MIEEYKNFRYKTIDEQDKIILDVYHLGFSNGDEYPSVDEKKFDEIILQKAYDIGKIDFRVGDDVFSVDYDSPDSIVKRIRDSIRLNGIIKTQHIQEKTGMIHLDDLEGKIKRENDFPIGCHVRVEPAHWYGEYLVLRCYNHQNNKMNYFDCREVFLENPYDLIKNYYYNGVKNDLIIDLIEKYWKTNK